MAPMRKTMAGGAALRALLTLALLLSGARVDAGKSARPADGPQLPGQQKVARFFHTATPGAANAAVAAIQAVPAAALAAVQGGADFVAETALVLYQAPDAAAAAVAAGAAGAIVDTRTKLCGRCKEDLPASAFDFASGRTVAKGAFAGMRMLFSYCKPCHTDYKAAQYLERKATGRVAVSRAEAHAAQLDAAAAASSAATAAAADAGVEYIAPADPRWSTCTSCLDFMPAERFFLSSFVYQTGPYAGMKGLQSQCQACMDSRRQELQAENPMPYKLQQLVANCLQRVNRYVNGEPRNPALPMLPMDIDAQWAGDRAAQLQGRSQMTGVPFVINRLCDWKLSMNQKVSGLGYTRGPNGDDGNAELFVYEENVNGITDAAGNNVQVREGDWTLLFRTTLDYLTAAADSEAQRIIEAATAAQLALLARMAANGQLRRLAKRHVDSANYQDRFAKPQRSTANNITVEEAMQKLLDQQGRCFYSFMVLVLATHSFWQLSLERINNALPHTNANTVWVVRVLNCTGNAQAEGGVGISPAKWGYWLKNQTLVQLTQFQIDAVDAYLSRSPAAVAAMMLA